MVQYEKEICQYLGIPSIPKRKWDGEKSFLQGCAVTTHMDGSQSYAVATYDNEKDAQPRIKKVFNLEIYKKVEDIFVVPSYMDTNVDDMDLDDDSKEKAKILVDEANELEISGSEQDFCDEPNNEYYFENITNDDEAKAFIRAYYKKNNKTKTKIPRTHEGLIVRLSVIYNEINKSKKK